jgi:hypothetical protein
VPTTTQEIGEATIDNDNIAIGVILERAAFADVYNEFVTTNCVATVDNMML